MRSEYLFVYGTLLQPFKHFKRKDLIKYSQYVSKGRFPGVLYEVSDYPGAVFIPNESTWVYGEIHKIKDASLLFKSLDEYEECSQNSPEPHEYHKEQLFIHSEDGKKRLSWVYLYNHETESLKRINSGNYIDHRMPK